MSRNQIRELKSVYANNYSKFKDSVESLDVFFVEVRMTPENTIDFIVRNRMNGDVSSLNTDHLMGGLFFDGETIIGQFLLGEGYGFPNETFSFYEISDSTQEAFLDFFKFRESENFVVVL